VELAAARALQSKEASRDLPERMTEPIKPIKTAHKELMNEQQLAVG